MKILFVGLSNNSHTARWLNQLADEGWDLHLFSSDNEGAHPALRRVTVHDYFPRLRGASGEGVRVQALDWPLDIGRSRVGSLLARTALGDASRRLARLIRSLKPDIVHSLGIQHGGYLALEARRHLGSWFPKWLVSNWGSDIQHSAEFEEEASKIRAVLAACEGYACECLRDVGLAKKMGFTGEVWPVRPNAGGIDLAQAKALRDATPASRRRLVMVKGYQHWYGRALVALRALELCAPQLQGYRVAVYSSSGPDVESATQLLARRTGVAVEIVPRTSHEQILKRHSQARVSISLSTTDGICTSFLEAAAMGSFPVQSDTACADEWAQDGRTARFCHPDDPQAVAAALGVALTDDALVDRASDENWRTISERLDAGALGRSVVQSYLQFAER